jgi:hypothetical protein
MIMKTSFIKKIHELIIFTYLYMNKSKNNKFDKIKKKTLSKNKIDI